MFPDTCIHQDESVAKVIFKLLGCNPHWEHTTLCLDIPASRKYPQVQLRASCYCDAWRHLKKWRPDLELSSE